MNKRVQPVGPLKQSGSGQEVVLDRGLEKDVQFLLEFSNVDGIITRHINSVLLECQCGDRAADLVSLLRICQLLVELSNEQGKARR